MAKIKKIVIIIATGVITIFTITTIITAVLLLSDFERQAGWITVDGWGGPIGDMGCSLTLL